MGELLVENFINACYKLRGLSTDTSGAGSRLVPGASGGSSAARGSDVGPVWVPMVLEVLVQVPRWFCVAAEVLVWFQRVQCMVPCRRRQLES
jgi:hypothetical protein